MEITIKKATHNQNNVYFNVQKLKGNLYLINLTKYFLGVNINT